MNDATPLSQASGSPERPASAGPALGADTAAALDRAADWLRSSRVVAFPTETVYGLGASALDERAVALVYALKGRPANNPLIVHVGSIEMARSVCRGWPEPAQRLAERFWPGPLTLVLPRAGVVPPIVAGGGDSVAVRMPDHPLALALIHRFGGPIVGPSANRSGMISPTTADHVREAFSADDRVLILDGGPCRTGIESTVLSLRDGRYRVLRPGAISAGAIAEALGQPVESPASPAPASPETDPASPLPSPGMLTKHYAPRTPARLVERASVPGSWLSACNAARTVVVIGSPEGTDIARAAIGDAVVLAVVMPSDAAEYARRLYAALHEADAVEAGLILIEQPDARAGFWDAIRDRLARATAQP